MSEPRDSLRGRFLVAVSSLRDPNFHRTVILVCEHGPEGALGLVVNRPTELAAREVLGGIEGADGVEARLAAGGPVQPECVFYLHDREDLEGELVAPGLRFGGEAEVLARLFERLGSEPDLQLRLFMGYAGWGAGQLERELEAGSWAIAPAEAEEVYREEGLPVWQRVLRRLGGRWAIMSLAPPEPDMN